MEPQKNNDLFFTCSLIEYIARKTKSKSIQKRREIYRYISRSFRILDNWEDR